jgi:sortase A
MRPVRLLSTILLAAGLLTVAWAVVAWRWQEPITALEHWNAQRQLTRELQARPWSSGSLTTRARSFRLTSRNGEAMGRIAIPEIGLDAVLVDGTSETDLAKGPGIYAFDYLPGEGRLVYIAGHRTTYGAPFSHLDRLRAGDAITIAMPYGTFRYLVTGHRIVRASDIAVLRSHRHEQLILQTCHPRFSASHRYLVYAVPAHRPAATARRRLASRVAGTTLSPAERSFLAAINETRAAHGVGRVALDAALVEAARVHSNDMVERGYFRHGPLWWRRLEQFGFTYGTVGEILGWYKHLTGAVSKLVQMWLRSPEHRVILLSPVYRVVGVGVAFGRFEGFPDAVVVTADFWSA